MKNLVVGTLLSAMFLLEVAGGPAQVDSDGKYLAKIDDANLDLILGSKRLVGNFVDCLLSKKPCTAEGEKLKTLLPDAIRTDCAKCTAKQRDGAKKVVMAVKERYPEQWNALLKSWDLSKFEAAL